VAELPEQAVEGIPGLKQGRDACDVAFYGHGKSLKNAFALGLAIAAPAIRKQRDEEILEAITRSPMHYMHKVTLKEIMGSIFEETDHA
jgi:hypothetical protein